jgi:hypothetical protein
MTTKPKMSLVSSRTTVIAKRVAPCLLFGFLGLYFIIILASVLAKQSTPVGALFVPILPAAFGYGTMKVFIWPLMDEVYDCGEYLLLRNKNIEEKVYFSNISELTYFLMSNAPRVTLTLKAPCKFGSEISFIPKTRIIRFLSNPTVRALRERIENSHNTHLKDSKEQT